MGQSLSAGRGRVSPLLAETQVFALWTVEDVRALQRRVRLQVSGFSLVEIQFESVMQGAEEVAAHVALPKLFAILDNDCDGRIDCLELLGGLALVCASSFEDKARFCFELYDFNLNGTLSRKEMTMMMILSVCGLNVLAGGREENEPLLEVFEGYAADAFVRADRDHSGQISFDEFVVWARANRDIMAALESLSRVTREARLLVEADDSASELSEDFPHADEDPPSFEAATEGAGRGAGRALAECASNLVLAHVTGFGGSVCYVCDACVLYSSAALAVVQSLASGEQRLYARHLARVVSVSASANGQLAATADESGAVHVWSPASLASLAVLRLGEGQRVLRAVLSPLADRVAVIAEDAEHSATLWDVGSGAVLGTSSTVPRPGSVHAAVFSRDGAQLAVVGTRRIVLLACAGGTGGGLSGRRARIGRTGKLQSFLSAAFVADDELVVGCATGELYLVRGGQCVRAVSCAGAAVTALAFSSAEGLLFSGADGCVRTWDRALVAVGEPVELREGGALTVLSLDCASGRVLAGCAGEVLEASLVCSSVRTVLAAHGGVWGLAAHPVVGEVATCGDDGTVRVWRVAGHALQQLRARATPERARALAYSSCGALLCLGMRDGAVALLESDTLRACSSWRHTSAAVTCVSFAANGRLLAVAAADKNVYVYASEDRRTFARHTVCGAQAEPSRLDFSRDSRLLLASGVGWLALWDRSGVSVSPCALSEADWHGNCAILPLQTGLSGEVSCRHSVPDLAVTVLGVGAELWLTRFPRGAARAYHGHCARVAGAVFTASRRHVVSVGGADMTMLLWRHELEMDGESSDDEEEEEGEEEGEGEGAEEESPRGGSSEATGSLARLPAPDDHAARRTPTDVDLELAWVHGFSGALLNAVALGEDGSLLYPAAKVVVSQRAGRQAFLHGAHEARVSCLCAHPSGRVFASGEAGARPLVVVWAERDMATLLSLRTRLGGVRALSFSDKGELLAALGNDGGVLVLDWRLRLVLVSAACAGARCMGFLPAHVLALGGPFGVRFWTLSGRNHSSQRALWGRVRRVAVRAVCALASGLCATGAADGSIMIWRDCRLVANLAVDAAPPLAPYPHAAPVQCLLATRGQTRGQALADTLVCGDAAGCVSVWEVQADGASGRLLRALSVCDLPPRPRDPCVTSLCAREDRLVVGLRGCEILDLSLEAGGAPSQRLVCAHSGEGELLAMDSHPTLPLVATLGDDLSLRCWALPHALLSFTFLASKAHCLAFSSSGASLLVGLASGAMLVVDTDALVNPAKKPGCLIDKDLKSTLIELGGGGEGLVCAAPRTVVVSAAPVLALRFSPDGAVLAASCADRCIYVCDAKDEFKCVRRLEGHKESAVNVDFGVALLRTASASSVFKEKERKVCEARVGGDGKVETSERELAAADLCVQSCSASGELLFWMLGSGAAVGAALAKDFWWASHTCTRGWAVDGAAPVTSLDRCRSWALVSAVASTDAAGAVRLFDYPCSEAGAPDKTYLGHSGAVAVGRWSCDDAYFVSAGSDLCVFVWKSDVMDEVRERMSRGALDSEPTPAGQSAADDFESALVLRAPGAGDESSAVRPWKAAAREPSNWKPSPEAGAAPTASLELAFVYGYRGYDCRNNIGAVGGRLAYHTAAVGVVYDSHEHRQTHCLEHDDDIVCLAAHPSDGVVASGETGKTPKLVLWSAETGATLRVIMFHSRGVGSVAFSCGGALLVSVGMDDERAVAVHNWSTGALVGKGKCGRGATIHALCAFEGGFVTGGKDHVRFWEVPGAAASTAKELGCKAGAYHKSTSARTVVSVAAAGEDVCTGMSDGSLCKWMGRANTASVQAHRGAVTAMCAVAGLAGAEEAACDRVASGGKDGWVYIWSNKFEKEWSLDMNSSSPLSLKPEVSALALVSGNLVIGTAAAEIFEANLLAGTLLHLVEGHYEARAEASALATANDSKLFATAGDDCTVRLWDGASFRQRALKHVGSKVRALAFSTDGSQLALGCFEGKVVVLQADLSERVAEVALSSAWIQAMRYSPDGATLAVGSHDSNVYLVNSKSYSVREVCKGHHSFVTAIDFSSDSAVLQSASGDYELLFWSSRSGKQMKSMAEVCDIKWSSWSSTIGWPVQGIFPPSADGTDVNSVSRSADGKLLVTGDDFRRVKLFAYPAATEGAKFREYKGHSEHVAGVAFLSGGGVVSIGGLDKTVMQFSLRLKA